MNNLSVDEARSILMGDDIKPMTVDAGADDKGNLPKTGALEGEERLQVGDGQGFSEADAALEDAALAKRSFESGAVGLGVDIVEIDRMKAILTRRPAFAEQVFSVVEQLYCNRMANPATHYALRFAAKEAVVKALGTGFSDGIWVRDIEVDRDQKGKPFVKLSGRALEVAEQLGVRDLSISLSYTRNDAVACAMAVTESAIRATEKRKDPTEELARQFKETRKMLDEL